MKSNVKRPILILLALSLAIFLSLVNLWAASPATEVATSPDAGKKGEKLVVKGREFCTECIDNSECLGCHTKISERKFAQSVHGALSCNGCHWDIIDVKAHLKAKGSKIQAEPITCHRCHKKEGAEHYASAHFINDVQCKDCHKEIHEMTAWKGDKVRVIEKCTTCHSDDGYAESVHGKVGSWRQPGFRHVL